MCRQIHLYISNLKNTLLTYITASAEHSLNSCHKDLGAEWLGNVLVNTQSKACQLISFIRLCRKHYYRDIRVLSYLLTGFKSVHLRHHDIKKYQCDILVRHEYIYSLFAVSRLKNLISCLNKEILNKLSHSAFIINH